MGWVRKGKGKAKGEARREPGRNKTRPEDKKDKEGR